MRNATLVKRILEKFNKVYGYADKVRCDEPLFLLDASLNNINLRTQFDEIIEADDEDRVPNVINEELVIIYACLNYVVSGLREEYGVLRY